MIGILILAAGSSTRLGRPKQQLLYRGKTLLQHAVEAAVSSLCQPVVVVLGAGAAQMQPELASYPVEVAFNPDWEAGMGRSLRVGMDRLLADGRKPDAVVVTLCDQPFVESALILSLISTFHGAGGPIVACEYGSSVGVPALFSRELFPELIAVDGATGARSVIARDSARVRRVSFPGGLIDIDTIEDYERLMKDNPAKLGYSSP